MKIRLVDGVFIGIGVVIGTILVLQIQSSPVSFGSSTPEQIELRRDLFHDYRLEQEVLGKQLEALDSKQKELETIIEQRTSKDTRDKLQQLRSLTGFADEKGSGIVITLNDSATASRADYSVTSDNFVQSADLRDAVNALFLQEAKAVSVNGERVTPLTSIRSAFDSIFIGNIQVTAPFIIRAIGNQGALEGARDAIRQNGIRVFIDRKNQIEIAASKLKPDVEYITKTQE